MTWEVLHLWLKNEGWDTNYASATTFFPPEMPPGPIFLHSTSSLSFDGAWLTKRFMILRVVSVVGSPLVRFYIVFLHSLKVTLLELNVDRTRSWIENTSACFFLFKILHVICLNCILRDTSRIGEPSSEAYSAPKIVCSRQHFKLIVLHNNAPRSSLCFMKIFLFDYLDTTLSRVVWTYLLRKYLKSYITQLELVLLSMIEDKVTNKVWFSWNQMLSYPYQ